MRSATEADVEAAAKAGKFSDPVVGKRAMHVVSEIARTELAAEVLSLSNFELFGKLMVESHASLR